ncbi:hypothetical protein RE428_41730 [Marinobacter nanhaiticus D15-8W]|nr:hypothetical protein [Marinobacter nanhaiticus]BES73155.1 hypothetical protein RE428_41730 [Marinobacter nanhaiticus D15-8W]
MTLRKAVLPIFFVVSQFGLFLPAQADTLGILSLEDEAAQVDDSEASNNR